MMDDDQPSIVPGRDDALGVFRGHGKEPVYCAAWAPGAGGTVATGGGDDCAFLWKASDPGAPPLALTGHTDSISSVAYSHDGALLATAAMDGRVLVWDVATGRQQCALEGPGDSIEWVQWHPRGHVVLAGSADFTCWMWNGDTGACMQVFSGHSDSVTCGTFTPDGKGLVTGSLDGSVRVWEPRSGQASLTIQHAGGMFHSAGVTALALSGDGNACLTGSEDGGAFVSHPGTGRVLGELAGAHGAKEDAGEGEEGPPGSGVEVVGFCPHLPLLATADTGGKLVLWDAATLTQRSVCMHSPGKAVVALRWHPSAPVAVTGSVDGAVRAWDCRTGACVAERRGHTEPVMDLALSPDGSRCVSASDDGTARVFSLAP